MKKVKVNTSWAYLIWAFFLVVGYGFAGFKPEAPFGAFAMWLTMGLGMKVGKRLFQKKKEFGGKEINYEIK